MGAGNPKTGGKSKRRQKGPSRPAFDVVKSNLGFEVSPHRKLRRRMNEQFGVREDTLR
jgi:hypothetical protein